jgi:cyclase
MPGFARTIAALSLLSLPLAAQQPDVETTRVADGVYRFRYQAHNTMFVTTPDGVVAFDPINADAAAQYAAAIRQAAPAARLRAIVYSHDHADHASGADILRAAFGDTVPIIAHAAAHAPIVAAASADQPPPTLTFDDEMTLHFGGRTVELHYVGPSHSDNMIVAVVPDARVAFALDFVSHDRMGYRDLSSFRFPGQFEAIDRLLALEFHTIVFGHGPNGDRGSVERQLAYYRDLERAVRAAVAEGWTEDQAAERVRLPAYEGWDRYADWFPMNVRGMYRWVRGG